MNGWRGLLPEFVFTLGIGLVLLADLFLPRARKSWLSFCPALTVATLGALAICLAAGDSAARFEATPWRGF